MRVGHNIWDTQYAKETRLLLLLEHSCADPVLCVHLFVHMVSRKKTLWCDCVSEGVTIC